MVHLAAQLGRLLENDSTGGDAGVYRDVALNILQHNMFLAALDCRKGDTDVAVALIAELSGEKVTEFDRSLRSCGKCCCDLVVWEAAI